jgi:protein SCO1/2
MTDSKRYQPKISFGGFGLLCVLVLLVSCTSKPKEPKNVQRYPIEGKVIAVNQPTKEITLQHKDIPGYMKGMTMPFRIRDEWVFNVAHPGDELHGTLAVGADQAYITDVSINQSAATSDASSTSQAHHPEIGEAVPDFSFVDQNGRRVHLHQFRGKPLLLTFIYTRCPLPDFCIRMSNNFGQLVRDLKQSAPGVYGRLQLLSISIDPEYDKPAVLLRYGKTYAGAIDSKFEHWRFISGTTAETRKAADFFGLSYIPGNGQIVHSLRTVLVAPDGKIAAQYPGNEWTPGEVEAELKNFEP